MVGLTAKQRLFVAFYLGVSAGNATDAARRAGYRQPHEQGRRLVRKSTVSTAIDAKLDEASLSANEILARLSEIAQGGLSDFIEVDEGGYPRFNFGQAKRRGKLSLLKKFKQDDKSTQIEAHDPMRALELLGKYRRLWSEKQEEEDGPIRVIVEYVDKGPTAPAALESEEDP